MQITTLSDKCQSTQMNLDNDYRVLAENSNDKFIFMQSLKLSSYPDSDKVTLLQLQFLPNPKIITASYLVGGTDFISNIGGSLGLALGISFFSVVDYLVQKLLNIRNT